MSDAPFFEPLPDPEELSDEEEQVVDLPWAPPSHIVGVIVPVDVDVFRSDDVAVRAKVSAGLNHPTRQHRRWAGAARQRLGATRQPATADRPTPPLEGP